MSFLGLGSFGEGFVKGFAESANEALKRDIDRINNRIDKVAEIRFQRALDQQEKRKEKVDATVERLREGAKIIGGPNAEAFAAGLLQEYGSAGYDNILGKLVTAKRDHGQDLGQFLVRAGKDAPGQAGGQTYTLRDYAEAYLGAPKTLPSSIKVSADDTGVGSLVGAVLGKDIDITGRAQERSAAEIAALGVPSTYDSSIVIPQIKFKRFEFDMQMLPYDQRLTALDEELMRVDETTPSTNVDFPNQKAYLEHLRRETIQSRIDSAGDTAKLDAMKSLREITKDDEERADLTDQINTLSRQIQKEETAAAYGDGSVQALTLKAQDEFAAGNFVAFEETMRQISYAKTGKEPFVSLDEEIQRLEAELNASVGDQTKYNEISQEIVRLKKIREIGVDKSIPQLLDEKRQQAAALPVGSEQRNNIENEIQGLIAVQRIGETVTSTDFQRASATIDYAIEYRVGQELGARGAEFVRISRLIATGGTTVDQLTAPELQIYNEGLATKERIQKDVFTSMSSHLDPATNPAFYAVGVQRGYITGVPAEAATTSQPTTQTDAALAAGAADSSDQQPEIAFSIGREDGVIDVPQSAVDTFVTALQESNPEIENAQETATRMIRGFVNKYSPNNPEVAALMANEPFVVGDGTLDEQEARLERLLGQLSDTTLYSDEWINTARSAFARKRQVHKAADILMDMDFVGIAGDQVIINAISEGMGITKAEADDLIDDAQNERLRRIVIEKEEEEARRVRRPDELLDAIDEATNEEEYQAAVDAYIGRVPSRSRDDVIRSRPRNFSRGGLMSRRGG